MLWLILALVNWFVIWMSLFTNSCEIPVSNLRPQANLQKHVTTTVSIENNKLSSNHPLMFRHCFHFTVRVTGAPQSWLNAGLHPTQDRRAAGRNTHSHFALTFTLSMTWRAANWTNVPEWPCNHLEKTCCCFHFNGKYCKVATKNSFFQGITVLSSSTTT